MRGRRPKPTALKALQGNAGHRSKSELSGKEPAPPSGAPEPPDHLDARARKKWYERLGIMMQVAGWVTQFDGDVLAAYCSSYSRWQEAEIELPKLRRQMAKATAYTRGQVLNEINQMIGQQRQALKDMKSFGQEIGWSSAARTRIRIDNGQLPLPGLAGAQQPTPELGPLERSRLLAGA